MEIKKNIILVGSIWLAILIASLVWNYTGALHQQKQLALHTARSFFAQILITRQWNARHGGLYAPVTVKTQPNPYLNAADRDLTISPTLQLTRINPAFMTRQIAELAEESSGVQFHITSLRPIRPENRATSREVGYLQQFEQGLAEGGEMFTQAGERKFFYMAPLLTDPSCLPCHADQGYQEGDIRGGISITLPFPSTVPVAVILLSHLLIGTLGFVGLLLAGRKLSHSYTIIKHQAAMDALCGIPNRRSFSEKIVEEFQRSCRENQPLSLAMCDIDHFKAYNDQNGHSAGDDCLQRVAQTIKASLQRPGDFCARYGGEEFVVIMSATEHKGALQVAERIRAAVEELAIPQDRFRPERPVTLSLGVATFTNQSAGSHEELIKEADQALYLAKEGGRNRVCGAAPASAAAEPSASPNSSHSGSSAS